MTGRPDDLTRFRLFVLAAAITACAGCWALVLLPAATR